MANYTDYRVNLRPDEVRLVLWALSLFRYAPELVRGGTWHGALPTDDDIEKSRNLSDKIRDGEPVDSEENQ